MRTRISHAIKEGLTRVVVLAVASSCLPAAPPAFAQSSPTASAPSSEPSVPLERLISNVARKTGKTFIVDPRVRADIVIIGRPAGDLSYAELLGVLDIYGFAAVEDTGFVRVVPDMSIKIEAIPTITARDTRPASEWVSEIIAVKNISAAQLVPILRPLVPQSGTLVASLTNNSVVIVDRFANLRRLEGLIRTLDSIPPQKVPGSAPSGESTGTDH